MLRPLGGRGQDVHGPYTIPERQVGTRLRAQVKQMPAGCPQLQIGQGYL